MSAVASQTWRSLLDLVYPRCCGACGRPVGREAGYVCWDCLAGADVITDPLCSQCGDPVEGLVEHSYRCSFCQTHSPHFDLARSAVRHRGAFQTLIHGFKYDLAVWLASDLAGLLLACVRAHYADIPFDVVAFVPLHPRKERERTYNQSRALARRVARDLGLPAAGLLRRPRDTATQTGLNAHRRRLNMKDAFAAVHASWVEGRSVLLVDDVMTTGATVNECARVLKRAGAVRVCVATVARG